MLKREEKPDFVLITGYTDFRCGINSLCMNLVEKYKLDPFANAVYLFMCRSKDKIKLLYWGGSGFWFITYRLEEGKFRWLKGQDFKKITYQQLEWLLNGLDIEQKTYIKEYQKKDVI